MFTCKNIFCFFSSCLEIILIRFASFNESTDWITSNSRIAFLALFLCKWPMRWSSILFLLINFLFLISASWILLSPIIVRWCCMAESHIPGGKDLVTATIVIFFVALPDLIAAFWIRVFTSCSLFSSLLYWMIISLLLWGSLLRYLLLL